MVDLGVDQLEYTKVVYKDLNAAKYLGNVGGTDIFRFKDTYFFSNVATGECEAYNKVDEAI